RRNRRRNLANKKINGKKEPIRRKYGGDTGIENHGVEPHHQCLIAHSLNPGQADQDSAPPGGTETRREEILVTPVGRRARIKSIEPKKVVASQQGHNQQPCYQHNGQRVLSIDEITEDQTQNEYQKVEDQPPAAVFGYPRIGVAHYLTIFLYFGGGNE